MDVPFKNIDWSRVTLLRDFCIENNCIFLTPGNSRSPTIHQWDDKIKKIREVDVPEGGQDLIKSYQLLVGMFRFDSFSLQGSAIKYISIVDVVYGHPFLPSFFFI